MPSTTTVFFYGQTDSGKSTLCGHLLVLTGYFDRLSDDERKLYRQPLQDLATSVSPSRFSVLMDLLDGEILSGKTKTREFNVCRVDHRDRSYTLIDTPGHALFIRNLVGALFQFSGEINVFCLVVSSLPKEFRDGCRHLLVLWNKMDLGVPAGSDRQTLLKFCQSLRFRSVRELRVSAFSARTNQKRRETTHPGKSPPGRKQTPCMHDRLISCGFQFVLHHATGEFTAEIERLEKSIVTVRDARPLKMILKLDREMPETASTKLVFRHQQKTIGFGEIYIK